MINISNIWIFEIEKNHVDDTVGFIIANTEDEALKLLALQKNMTIEQLQEIAFIYPINALDLNKPVHYLWNED